jgi:hypothetical protein
MNKKLLNNMVIGMIIVVLSIATGYGQGDNTPDPMVNLGMTGTITGNAPEDGRGITTDILYDPATGGFASSSTYHEYGMGYNKIMAASKEDPLYWQVEWETAKNVNYITCGGVFGNQPQPTTGWSVQMQVDGEWQDLAKAHDGWDADTLRGLGMGVETQTQWVWDGMLVWRGLEPVVTTGIRFNAYGNPDSLHLTLIEEKDPSFADSLWSFAWTGRRDINNPDKPRATLIQYLDFSEVEADNELDPMVNLGLLPEAVVSANINLLEGDENYHEGRGQPIDVMFDPVRGDYHNKNTAWGEFGYDYDYVIGYPDNADDGFQYIVEWPVPKTVNFITWGGIYGNQPQPNTIWELQYWDGEAWEILIDGIGGTFDEGDTLWPYTPGVDSDAQSIWMTEDPITTTKMRLCAFSDGVNPFWSFVIRCRGGACISADDERDNPFKAVLVQWSDLVDPTAIGSEALVQPSKFALHQNFPNPFNPQTNIQFVLPQAGHVKLSVFNVLGQEVAVLVNENKAGGSHQVTFDAAALSSGVYYYRITSDAGTMTKKMMVIK